LFTCVLFDQLFRFINSHSFFSDQARGDLFNHITRRACDEAKRDVPPSRLCARHQPSFDRPFTKHALRNKGNVQGFGSEQVRDLALAYGTFCLSAGARGGSFACMDYTAISTGPGIRKFYRRNSAL